MRLTIAAMLILSHTGVLAQEDSLARRPVPGSAIKISPLHLLNFYPTIELSYEHRIRSRITTQLEAGYVVNVASDPDDHFRDMRGVKLKLEGRYYLRSARERASIPYASIEPYMNIINFDRRSVVQECFDLECQSFYTRRLRDKGEYREQGASLKMGTLWYIDPESRTFLDFNAGLTIRNINYNIAPTRQRFPGDEGPTIFDFPQVQDRVALSPCLGVRFGYRFN
jgi:hypothetical protein